MKAIFHWHGHGHLMKAILQLRFSLPRYSRLNQDDIKTNTWGRVHSIHLSLVAFTSYPLNLSMLNQITECIFQDQAIFHHVYIPHGLYSNAVSNHPYLLYTISWHPSFSWKPRTHVLSHPQAHLTLFLLESLSGWILSHQHHVTFQIFHLTNFLSSVIAFLVDNSLFFRYIFFMVVFCKNLVSLMHFTIPVTTVSMVYILHLASPALSCFMRLIL